MEIVTRAIFDCLDEEIILLNEDIKEDAIISSIRNLISEEDVEFREDIDGNYRVTSVGQNKAGGTSDHLEKKVRSQQSPFGHGTSATNELLPKQKENNDDERSDLLAIRGHMGHMGHQDVPNLIAFKRKKRRHDPFAQEMQPQDITSSTTLNSSYFFSNNMRPDHQMEEVPTTNKNSLNLPRWIKKGKKGLLSPTRKTRSLENSRAEF